MATSPCDGLVASRRELRLGARLVSSTMWNTLAEPAARPAGSPDDSSTSSSSWSSPSQLRQALYCQLRPSRSSPGVNWCDTQAARPVLQSASSARCAARASCPLLRSSRGNTCVTVALTPRSGLRAPHPVPTTPQYPATVGRSRAGSDSLPMLATSARTRCTFLTFRRPCL